MPCMDIRKLPAIITQAAVCLIPYTADAFTRYILPTKLLECAALGVPVIASRLFTIMSYFDDNMVAYVNPGDHVDVANQIIRLYRNPEIAARLALNARRFSESYSWQAQKSIYYQLIDSLIPERQSARAALTNSVELERTGQSQNLTEG
jgi:glycosyltransferase involved in cell wall biosynthesis